MDFRERLQAAADRGMRTRNEREKQQAAEAITEEEYRRLHSSARLQLTDHIEACLEQLADNFPGFKYETIVSQAGWGGAVSRDDLLLEAGKRRNAYSRLQVLVGTHNSYHVLEISAKGAVRNKENFTRQHYVKLADADLDDFRQMIERWVLDYAEQYSAG
jgi:hypothetical protein